MKASESSSGRKGLWHESIDPISNRHSAQRCNFELRIAHLVKRNDSRSFLNG